MTTELSKPDRRNWGLYRKGETQNRMYSLALVHTGNQNDSTNSKLYSLAGGATEFSFPVNPKEMDLEEPSAVVIRPTQGGGKFIEHQGQIYKDIHLSGTTGLRPNPKKGVSSIAFSTDNGLPSASERTGFDDLIALRNVFRAYWMAKTDPDLASNVLMVWKNGKEGEYYVVEPITFKTSRDSSSPLTASYNISLKTIKRWEISSSFRIDDSFLNRRARSRQRSGLNRAIQALADGINEANRISDNILSKSASYLTDILQPTNELFSALANIATTSQRTLEIPKSALHTLSSNLMEAIHDISSTIALASSYDTQAAEVVSVFKNIRRAVTSIEVKPELFSSTTSLNLSVKSSQYVDSVFGAADSGGDLTDLSNESLGTGTGQGVVGANDNIRKLAKRLLGTASRWKVLVVANGLKAPYISKDGDGIDVLRPGDPILYPVKGSDSATAVSTNTDGKYSELSPVEERLGRDLMIASPASIGGISQFDLVASDSGDVGLIEGVSNMEQAVRIKFETEQGELPMHRLFGIKYPLGVKAPAATGFIEFDVNARATLLSDPRVDSIKDLKISFEGNALSINGGVTIKGFDSPLSFDFSTKR